jgi:hypothetical protein
MTPLDLRIAPPRLPRAEAGGIVFLPRSIDKTRALLPGGHLGDYTIDGFTQWMFDKFGIERDAFTAAVAAAEDDDELATFLLARANPGDIDAWNAFALRREPRNGDRAAALEAYPWLHARPDLIFAVDVLAEDDRQAFGT